MTQNLIIDGIATYTYDAITISNNDVSVFEQNKFRKISRFYQRL